LKKLVIFIFLITPILSVAQEIEYFKKFDGTNCFQKRAWAKGAKYEKKTYESNDSAIVAVRDLKSGEILRRTKRIKGKPVGVWTSSVGKERFQIDYGQVQFSDLIVYSDEKIEGFSLKKDNSYGIEADSCDRSTIASFIGGEEAFFKYLGEHVKVHADAKELGVSGMVVIRFFVSSEGVVIPHSLSKGLYPSLDLHVWNLFSNMPKWNPGTCDGVSTEFMFNVPLRFVLR